MSANETRVILVRHGETEWNQEGKFQGSNDIKLCAAGIRQAEKLAERFREAELDKIYASDLERAYQTGRIVAKFHTVSVEKLPAFREIDYGIWEGLTYKQIQQSEELTFAEWFEDSVTTRIPGGESLKDLKKRVLKALEEIVNENRGKAIMIITHGGVIRVLVGTLLGMPLTNCWKLEQGNTAVNIVKVYEYDENISINLFNSTFHLKDK